MGLNGKERGSDRYPHMYQRLRALGSAPVASAIGGSGSSTAYALLRRSASRYATGDFTYSGALPLYWRGNELNLNMVKLLCSVP